MSESIPIIVRIAGLPVEILESFSGFSCHEEVERTLYRQRELQLAQHGLVERIFVEVSSTPPALRRLLLTIKRDCFNGRSLLKHTPNPQWEEARRFLQPLLDRLLELEARLEHQIAVFKRTYEDEEAHQRQLLSVLLANSEFIRGVALASPDLLHSISRLDGLESESPRRERRAESSLMRYISRAAVKLSPFSTLTRIALGSVHTAKLAKECNFRLLGEHWSSRSLVRVRRLPLKHFCEILSLHPIFRSGLEIVLNNTLESIAQDRYRLLRPAHWGFENGTGEYTFVQDSIIRVTLTGPIITLLVDQLPGQKRTYGNLVETLVRSFQRTSPDQISQLLDNLIQVGFLRLIMPWPGNTVNLEDELLTYLRLLPPEPVLKEVRHQLEEIVRIRDAYPGSSSPARCVDDVDQLLVTIWNLIKPLAGLPLEAQITWLRRHNLNEDVLLLSPHRQEPILELAGTVAESLQQTLAPLVQISNLFSQRYDVLHTVAEFARQRWPQRTEVGMLELYGEFQLLWRQYTEFQGTISNNRGPVSFNPLNLEAVEYLQALRVRISESWCENLIEQDGETLLCQDKIELLSLDLPDLYRPIAATCLFLQSADRSGNRWMLNSMLDGMGRYSSRYTPLFNDETYREYAKYYGCRPTRAGEPELVDLMSCSQGDNLNFHRVPSMRIIEIPGEVSDVSPADCLTLRDLRVDWSGTLPRLLDRTGQHLVPVHLSPVSLRLMPALVRFLAVFGPSDFGLVLPPRSARDEEGTLIFGRLRIGQVILRRQRWTLALDDIRKETKALSDADFFLAINRWRIARRIPNRVFLEEKIPVKFFERDIFKPQYIDFTSPLFIRIFRSILHTELTNISVQEVLPDTDCAPRDGEGQRWAVELQLDLSAMNRIAFTPQPSPSTLYEGLFMESPRLSEKGDVNGREARVR